MTYTEVLHIVEVYNGEHDMPKHSIDFNNECTELIKAALEKQIPFKPTPCNITLGRCKCGVGFLTKDTQFCGNCGQRLDWSVE